MSSSRWPACRFHFHAFPENRTSGFLIGTDSNAIQLTFTHAQDSTWPHWSPVGKLIAFSSNAEGEWDIYVVPSAGGKSRKLTSHRAIDIRPSYSQNGKEIFFDSVIFEFGKCRPMAVMQLQVTPNQGRGAHEGEDGNIYYHSVSMIASLWRSPTTGGNPATTSNAG